MPLSLKQLPPLKLRKHHFKSTDNPDLSYVGIPVYNFISDTNTRAFDSCPFADATSSYRWKNHPEIFNDVAQDIMPFVRHPLAMS